MHGGRNFQAWRSRGRIAFLVLAFTSAGIAVGQSANELNARGVEHYNAGQWESAIEAFEQASASDPDNTVIRTNVSNAYQAYATGLVGAGNFSQAISLLERLLKLDPSNVQPYIQLGAYYLHEGLVNDAIYRLEDAIELAPGNIDAHFLLGEAYYKDNDTTAAVDQWEWVYRAEPEKPGLKERLEAALREERVEYDFKGDSSRNFNVTYSREAEGQLVRKVLRTLENAYREIGRAFGHVYPPTPIQVSLYTARDFSETTQMGDHVGAVYDGTKIRCPVLDEQGTVLSQEELKRRLYHEYVHVIVQHLAKNNAPWWLNEGLAEALSTSLDPNELASLRQARKDDTLPSLQSLEGNPLETFDVDRLRLAYTMSHVAILIIQDRQGMRSLTSLLRMLGEGEARETALRSTSRMNYHTLDLAVQHYIDSAR
jgi:Flp pilus assembly protein TadD